MFDAAEQITGIGSVEIGSFVVSMKRLLHLISNQVIRINEKDFN
jgi:hypothetical protein